MCIPTDPTVTHFVTFLVISSILYYIILQHKKIFYQTLYDIINIPDITDHVEIFSTLLDISETPQ